MKIVCRAVLCIFLILTGGFAAHAAKPVLTGKDVSEAVEVPSQAPQEGVTDFLLELREERPGCTLAVLTYLPQGLGVEIDKTFAGIAKSLHAEAYAEVLERSDFFFEQRLADASSALFSGEPLPEEGKRDWGNTFASVATYALSHPSKKYVSVLYRMDMGGGGAHGNWVYRAFTLNRESGSEVTLQMLFPGKENAEEALAALVAKALSGKVSDMGAADLDIGLKRIVLTPQGARVIYAPYEIAAFSEGEFMADIALQDLLGIGANPEIWGRTAR